MKSNKGFTLIELLAVIVILAVIALIATPTILGVIDTARKGAAEASALGYIDAVEKQMGMDMIEKEMNPSYTAVVNVGTDGSIEIPVPKLNVKGTVPKDTSTMTVKDGKISSATIVFEDYTVTYSGTTNTITVEKNS